MCDLVNLLFRLMQLAIIGRVLYSWVDPSPYATNPLKAALWTITEPLLEPLRRVIPPTGMFDLTPLVALIALGVVQEIVLQAFGGPFGCFY